ncbi:RALFL33, putative [Ricinus communis]|uniref:RALFL33, putative n=1 Tax=Ricinus communis TaxID=3988 RepID=B9SC80_RICCO|nr:RALFL33, putative [Ricinus communis]
MAIPKLSLLLFPIFLTLIPVRVNAQVEETSGLKIITDWPTGMSMYGDLEESNGEFFDEDIDDGEMGTERRSLFWRRVHYYISYGALSANRIPCPPRSGRSYYTHNCFHSRAPVNPYTRGCSRITRCRR